MTRGPSSDGTPLAVVPLELTWLLLLNQDKMSTLFLFVTPEPGKHINLFFVAG